MKTILFAGAALALSASAAFAADDHKMSDEDKAAMTEWVEGCEAAKSEDSMTDCKCLYKEAKGDEAVMADLDAYDPEMGMESMGEAGTEAVMACQKSEDM